MYHETTISRSGGFSEWQTNPTSGEAGWEDDNDLEAEMRANCAGTLYELGVDDLPSQVEDIRGAIHEEPWRVFAAVYDDGSVSYHGIVEED